MTRVKVISYNIHKGFASGRKRFILNRIRELFQDLHPDLIFLQEVVGENQIHGKSVKEWPTQSQFEFLADQFWPHYAYGKNAVYQYGHHGNAILSKYPFISFENIDVSMSRFERRGLLHGVISISGKLIHLICAHLGLIESERMLQIHRLCSRIESHVPHDEPLIIGGDFNDWRQKASHPLQKKLDVQEAFLKTQGEHARSFPCWLPALRLDRIYYRGVRVQNAQCLTEKPWNQLSDHAALFAEFQL